MPNRSNRSEVSPVAMWDEPGLADPLDQDRAASMADEGGSAAVTWEAPEGCTDSRSAAGLILLGVGVGTMVALWFGGRGRRGTASASAE
jgi:hypothetical protein